MKNIVRVSILGLLGAFVASAQLNSLVQTSLSAAITANQTSFNVAAATGINAPTSAVPGSDLFIQDLGQTAGEVVSVVSVTSTTLVVRRGSRGTKAKAHLSGAMVLVATAPNWFYSVDPQGSCTTASTYVAPYLNIVTGNQWLCSTITLSWVPGWGNFSASPQATLLVASVGGTTAVSGPLLHINGTNAVTAFQPTVGWQGEGFCTIPDAAYTATTGGTTVASTRVIAIASALTAVLNKTLCYAYDATNSKFVPSY